MSRSPRVVIFGYFGAGNLGDEAILAGMLAGIRERLPSAEFLVLSAEPDTTHRIHGVTSLDRLDIHAIGEALADADALVFGGGGLCNDYWWNGPAAILDDAWGGLSHFLRIPALAMSLGVPVEIVGQGVGPLSDPVARRQVRWVFAGAAHVGVRDRGSGSLLRELGFDGPVEVYPDPAVLLATSIRGSATVRSRPLVGIALRSFRNVDDDALVATLSGTARLARAVEADLVGLPFSHAGRSDDRDTLRRIAEKANVDLPIREDLSEPSRSIEAVRACSLLVTMRLHGAIFGVMAGVPTLALPYDPKVTAFAEESGLPSLGLDTVDADAVVSSLTTLWESRHQVSEHLAAVGSTYLESSRLAIHALADRLASYAERRTPARRTWTVVPGTVPSARARAASLERWLEAARDREAQLRRTLETVRERERQLTTDLEASRSRQRDLERRLASSQAQLEQLGQELATARQRSAELAERLEGTRATLRDVSDRLEQVWASPYWRLLVRITSSRWVLAGWRLVPGFLKRLVKGWAGASAAGTSGEEHATTVSTPEGSAPTPPRDAAAVYRSEGELAVELERFLERVNSGDSERLALWVSGVKYVASEGQRVTQMVRALTQDGVPCLLVYFRWQSERGDPVPRGTHPLLFQIPMDVFDRLKEMVFGFPFRNDLHRTAVMEFPHPSTFQWINEFNLAGWKTVYDVIDDWPEFHRAGKAIWYEDAVERYLCRNAGAVAVVAPPLADQVRSWVPGRDVAIVPNGVDPDSFSHDVETVPLQRGEVTVGYFGYLAQAWFDWNLLADAARKRPTWKFHIIGYGEPPAAQLPSNVELLGKVKHHLLPAYTANWDVGIVPFQRGTLSAGADPIKVYEYLHLGLPVVATGVPHVGDYPGVRAVGADEDFVAALEAAAHEPFPRDEARRFVASSTWLERGRTLLDLPGDLPPPVTGLLATMRRTP